jgi:hypothetical protein
MIKMKAILIKNSAKVDPQGYSLQHYSNSEKLECHLNVFKEDQLNK